MKFECSVLIDRPIDEVIPLWDNEDNLDKWQEGFQHMHHISGNKGDTGAVSMMHYVFRGRPMELKETITLNDLPNAFHGLYEHKDMSNTMKNYFTRPSENQTLWRAELEYIKFNSFLPKMMFKLFPGMAKRQTQKWLDNFKRFAEDEAE